MMRVYRTGAKALLVVLFSAVLSCLQGANAATINWTLSPNVPFSDGGILNGYFGINEYGFTNGTPYDLQTSGGSPAFAQHYTTEINADNESVLVVRFNAPDPPYSSLLRLEFANSLLVPIAVNPIVGGLFGPSWECETYTTAELTCPGTIRYVLGGFASADGLVAPGEVPLPAALPLFIGGAGLIGFLARRKQKRMPLAT
jgi:hypothetical protein